MGNVRLASFAKRQSIASRWIANRFAFRRSRFPGKNATASVTARAVRTKAVRRNEPAKTAKDAPERTVAARASAPTRIARRRPSADEFATSKSFASTNMNVRRARLLGVSIGTAATRPKPSRPKRPCLPTRQATTAANQVALFPFELAREPTIRTVRLRFVDPACCDRLATDVSATRVSADDSGESGGSLVVLTSIIRAETAPPTSLLVQ